MGENCRVQKEEKGKTGVVGERKGSSKGIYGNKGQSFGKGFRGKDGGGRKVRGDRENLKIKNPNGRSAEKKKPDLQKRK